MPNDIGKVDVGGEMNKNLRFVDGINGLAGSEDNLVNLVRCLNETLS